MIRRAAPLFFCAVFSAVSTVAAGSPARGARGVMGTVLAIEIPERGGSDAALKAAFAEAERLESIFSLFRPGSDLSRFNRAPAGTPIRVVPELHALARASLELNKKTNGAFDPTVEPLAKFWRSSREWTAGEWAKAAEAVGPSFIKVHETQPLLTRGHPAAGLTFGGIARGLALDRAAAVLKRRGAANAILNFGGQVLVVSRAQDVSLSDPLSGRDIARFMLRSGSAATSSQVDRSRMGGGRQAGHIIDPRTKKASERTGSVTVIAPTAQEADALSTALFVLGPIDGLRLLEDRFPQASAVWTEPAGIGWRLIPSARFPRIQVLSGAAEVALHSNGK